MSERLVRGEAGKTKHDCRRETTGPSHRRVADKKIEALRNAKVPLKAPPSRVGIGPETPRDALGAV